MNTNTMLGMAAHGLKNYYDNSEEIVKKVMDYGAAAAGAAALSGCLPGAGSTAAAAISLGIIVKMYIRLGKLLGVHLGSSVLKALASAVVADLAGSVVAILAVSTVLSFIPGIGSLGAATITGITSFCYVYLAGIIYINMVEGLLKSGKSIENMTESELKAAAKAASDAMDMKAAVKEAKAAFKENKVS